MTAPYTTPSAKQLERAVAGNREAVTELVEAFMPRVYGLALRLCRRQDVAEEAAQETFVRALRKLSTVRDPGRLPSWMLTICANTTREMLRKQRKTVSLDDVPELTPQDLGHSDKDADSETDERMQAVERAVATLGVKDRELFLLHTVHGVSMKDIARQHKTTEGAMKTKICRIRARVRAHAHRHLGRQESAA